MGTHQGSVQEPEVAVAPDGDPGVRDVQPRYRARRGNDVAIADQVRLRRDLSFGDVEARDGREPIFDSRDLVQGGGIGELAVRVRVVGHEVDGRRVAGATQLPGYGFDQRRGIVVRDPFAEVVKPAGVAVQGSAPVPDPGEFVPEGGLEAGGVVREAGGVVREPGGVVSGAGGAVREPGRGGPRQPR